VGGGDMKNESAKNKCESIFFLSKVVKTKVFLKGKKIGKLSDLIISERDKVAEVTYIVVSRPFGYPSLMVPWDKVSSFNKTGITIDLENAEMFAGKVTTGFILLKDYILDKKIQDVEGRDIKVVFDIRMVMRNSRLYITDVDSSENALFRRLGIEKLASLLQKKCNKGNDMLIPWSYLQSLPSDIGSFTGDVKLSILKEKFSYLPPVNVMDIFEELEKIAA
jgi:magnesium transporter